MAMTEAEKNCKRREEYSRTKTRAQQYYRDNRERLLDHNAAWYQRSKEERAEYLKDWYAVHRNQLSVERREKYAALHPGSRSHEDARRDALVLGEQVALLLGEGRKWVEVSKLTNKPRSTCYSAYRHWLNRQQQDTREQSA